MARDEALLHAPDDTPAIVRLYAWSRPTISLGYFQSFDEIAKLPDDVRGLPAVRRLTGGGAILHDLEVTYCLVLRASVPPARGGPAALYGLAHECWRDALRAADIETELAPDSFPLPTPRSGPFFCFERPGRTDLLLGGGKLLGSAQRRLSDRVLQHGSLIVGRRFASHPGASLGNPAPADVARWSDAFVRNLASALGMQARPAEWSAAMRAEVERRVEKYAGEEWTRRR